MSVSLFRAESGANLRQQMGAIVRKAGENEVRRPSNDMQMRDLRNESGANHAETDWLDGACVGHTAACSGIH